MSTVEIDLLHDALVMRPTGWHRVWSLRRRILVPYDRIVTVSRDPAFAHGGPQGWRMPGTSLPGIYHAGTFWNTSVHPHERSFWIRRDGENAIVLHLRDHHFDVICVEVDDPEAQVRRIWRAIWSDPRHVEPKEHSSRNVHALEA